MNPELLATVLGVLGGQRGKRGSERVGDSLDRGAGRGDGGGEERIER